MSNLPVLYSEEERALLAGVDFGIAGEENLEDGDVGMPPRLRISQPNRPIRVGDEEVTPGNILNSLTGQMWERIEFVPVMFLSRTRVMWPEKFDAESEPLCVSDDGDVPSRGTEPMPGPCATCPMAQFVDGARPRCAVQRNFIVWIVETGEPVILTMQSTAIASAKQLTALAKGSGIKRSITMATTKLRDSRGSWYVPVFMRGAALPASLILEIAAVRDELKNLVVRADVERAEFVDEFGDQDAAPVLDDIPF